MDWKDLRIKLASSGSGALWEQVATIIRGQKVHDLDHVARISEQLQEMSRAYNAGKMDLFFKQMDRLREIVEAPPAERPEPVAEARALGRSIYNLTKQGKLKAGAKRMTHQQRHKMREEQTKAFNKERSKAL